MIAGRQLSLNIVYRILNMGTVFGLTILLSRLCGVAGYGLFSLLIANVALFSLFSAAGSDAGITFHVATGTTAAGKLMRFAAGILIAQLAAAAAAEWLVYQVTGHYFFLHVNNWAQAWPGLVLFAAMAFTEKCNAWLLGKKAYTRSNQIILFSNLLLLIFFTYTTLSGTKHEPAYYICAWALLSLVQAVWMMIACIPYFSEQHTDTGNGGKAGIFSYSLFTFVINSIQFLAYRIDFWILDHFKGEQQLGWYALSVRLSQMFWVLPLMLATIIFPHTAAGISDRNEERLSAWIRMMNGLNIAAGLFLAGIASWLIPVLFGSGFRESAALFRILLPGVILFCIATLIAAYFGGKNELQVNLWGSLLCLVVIATLDLLLIPSMGMKGAAIASTAGYGVTGIYFLVRFCIRTKQPFFSLLLPRKGDPDLLTLRTSYDKPE